MVVMAVEDILGYIHVYADAAPCVPVGPADCQHTTGRPVLPTVETGFARMPHGVLTCFPSLGSRQAQSRLYHSPRPLALQPVGSAAVGRSH